MPRLYAYIDETGDEGFPDPQVGPHEDPTLYCCKHRHDRGPSPYFAVAAVLIKEEDRSTATKAMRGAANVAWPQQPQTVIHWKKLDLERKEAIIDSLKGVSFKWVIAKAHKPTLPKIYPAPLLYNYITRLVIERCNLEAKAQGRDLVLVFSHRGNTDYDGLKGYLRRELPSVKVVKIEIEQANRNRLLQLADIVCGAVKDATYQNRYGRVHVGNLRSLWGRIRKYNGHAWGPGFKAYPAKVHVYYGFAADFYARAATA